MSDEESIALRKKLLRLDKNEVARKCKKKHLSTGGTKSDMVDRLVEYNEENGGVTGAREGSNKNKKKKGSTAGGGGSKNSDKKQSKSGGGRGGGGGRSGGRSNGGGGRSNTGDGGGGGGFYCNCGGDGDADDENQNQNMRRLLGGILGAICLLLLIVAMGVNVLSRYSTDTLTVTCRFSEVRGCDENDNCIVVTYDDDCDACDNDCNSCKTKSGGQSWLAFNILAFIILLVGVVLVFVGHFSFKAQPFVKFVKIFYIVSAIFLFIGVIAWVGANDYNESCYDPDNDLGLGASNIIDVITGCLLVIGFLLVF